MKPWFTRRRFKYTTDVGRNLDGILLLHYLPISEDEGRKLRELCNLSSCAASLHSNLQMAEVVRFRGDNGHSPARVQAGLARARGCLLLLRGQCPRAYPSKTCPPHRRGCNQHSLNAVAVSVLSPSCTRCPPKLRHILEAARESTYVYDASCSAAARSTPTDELSRMGWCQPLQQEGVRMSLLLAAGYLGFDS